jgi:hypothetical protein
MPHPIFFAAQREIIPPVLRQAKDPNYFIKRDLPWDAMPLDTTMMASGSA